MISKSSLAVVLSKLKSFKSPKAMLEQYPTDSEVAADVLSKAYMLHDIDGKTILDAGCGTGILGIGCLFLDAKKVIFLDADTEALKILGENLDSLEIDKKRYEIINSKVEDFSMNVDLVVQNPPFGSKTKHADKVFLEKAFSFSKIVYSFHLTETREFVEKFSRDNKFLITHHWKYSFPLKKTMEYHKKKIERIEVGVWRFQI